MKLEFKYLLLMVLALVSMSRGADRVRVIVETDAGIRPHLPTNHSTWAQMMVSWLMEALLMMQAEHALHGVLLLMPELNHQQ